MSKPIELQQESLFKSTVLEASKSQAILVDFWAPWCGPCRAIAPILEKVAEKYSGKLTIVKVDVDQCTNLATTYNIRTIPNLCLFKDGEKKDHKIGSVGEQALIDFLSPYL